MSWDQLSPLSLDLLLAWRHLAAAGGRPDPSAPRPRKRQPHRADPRRRARRLVRARHRRQRDWRRLCGRRLAAALQAHLPDRGHHRHARLVGTRRAVLPQAPGRVLPAVALLATRHDALGGRPGPDLAARLLRVDEPAPGGARRLRQERQRSAASSGLPRAPSSSIWWASRARRSPCSAYRCCSGWRKPRTSPNSVQPAPHRCRRWACCW